MALYIETEYEHDIELHPSYKDVAIKYFDSKSIFCVNVFIEFRPGLCRSLFLRYYKNNPKMIELFMILKLKHITLRDDILRYFLDNRDLFNNDGDYIV
jgi:hypothetical protein